MTNTFSSAWRNHPVGKMQTGVISAWPLADVNAALLLHRHLPAVQTAKHAFGRIALHAGSAILE